MITIKGDLILEKDTTYEESIFVEGDILCGNGIRYHLTVKGDINARDINAWDINAWDINARDISFYAVCFAYNNIKCNKIAGRRRPHKKPFVLDGKITMEKNKKVKK